MKRSIHNRAYSANENDAHEIAAKRQRSRRREILETNQAQKGPSVFNNPTAQERQEALALDRYQQDDDAREAQEFLKETLKKPHYVIETDSMRALVTEEVFKVKSKFNIFNGHFRVHLQLKSNPTYNGPIFLEMLTCFREIFVLIVENFRKYYVNSMPSSARHNPIRHSSENARVYFTVLAENLTRGIHSAGLREVLG